MNNYIEDTSFEMNEQLLIKLKYYLNYELSGTLLFVVSFINEIALLITTVLAVIFTPFMFYVLYKTRKYGWILTFTSIILFPSIISIIILKGFLYRSLFFLIELGLTYLFFFLLRFAVNDWCEEINAKKYRMLLQTEKLEKESLFQKYFDNRI